MQNEKLLYLGNVKQLFMILYLKGNPLRFFVREYIDFHKNGIPCSKGTPYAELSGYRSDDYFFAVLASEGYDSTSYKESGGISRMKEAADGRTLYKPYILHSAAYASVIEKLCHYGSPALADRA